jgi:hypothetical protein
VLEGLSVERTDQSSTGVALFYRFFSFKHGTILDRSGNVDESKNTHIL